MKQSVDRILTTHTGSLPRPDDLLELILATEAGEPVDEAAFRSCIRRSVGSVVAQQVETGIEVVSDGEQSKISYATYVKDRMTGFGGEGKPLTSKDLMEFREYSIGAVKRGLLYPIGIQPCCQGPITLKDTAALAMFLSGRLHDAIPLS